MSIQEAPKHLAYHYISDEQQPGITTPPKRLEEQITFLKAQGFTIMTCGEVARCLENDVKLPARHATLSFDDGLKSQYKEAFPILTKLGVPATFFDITSTLEGRLPPTIGFQILIRELGAEKMKNEIVPDMFRGTPYADLLDPERYNNSGRKIGELEAVRGIKWVFNHFPSQAFKQELIDDVFMVHLGTDSQKRFAAEWFMTADELLSMQDQGMEVGSHTVSHPPFDVSGLSEIQKEATMSKRRLDEVLGKPVETFGWPFGGSFRPPVKEIILDVYTSGWNFYGNPKAIPQDTYKDVADIPRIDEQAFQYE